MSLKIHFLHSHLDIFPKNSEEVLQKSRKKGTSYIQQNEGRLTGLNTSCVGTTLRTLYWNEDRRKERRYRKM
jgi:hypothetical protein